MPTFRSYITGELPTPRSNLGTYKHGDVSLLPHMAIFACVESYKHSGQLLSRDAYFQIALSYVKEHLWPLTDVIPTDLAYRSIFLGHERFTQGSVRKWVADLQGLVLAQRFAAGTAGRRRKRADSWADQIRKDAHLHLQELINAAFEYAISNPALLIAELQQLQKELP